MPFDVVSFGETMLRLTPPQGFRLEETPTFQAHVAGSESNTLACLARLGLATAWASALPNNPPGRHITAELRRHGVDISHVLWTEETSRLGLFYAEESPQPLGVQVYYDRTHSACADVNPEVVHYSMIDDAKVLLLSGITPAISEHAREVFQRFLLRGRDKHIPLAFDVNYRAKLWKPKEAAKGIEEACRQAQILFCTRADATALWGFAGSAEAILQRMAERFVSTPSTILVLTLGSEGSAQWQNGVYSSEPAFPTEGTVRFGSGDAFSAGYLYAFLGGKHYRDLQELHGVSALAFGNAIAALKRCIPGDMATITPHEVRAIFQKEGRMFFR